MTEFQELPRPARVAIAASVMFIGSAIAQYLVVGLYLEWITSHRFAGFDIWGIPHILNAQPIERQNALLIFGIIVSLSLTTSAIAVAWCGVSNKYGDAEFASERELVKEGYASRLRMDTDRKTYAMDSEIVFAKYGSPGKKNALYFKPGPEVQKPHAIFVAPSGSGKTSGFVIPNYLRFNGSIVGLDVKGDIFKATAGRRKEMGDEVYVFDPEHPEKSHSYNPFWKALRTKDLDRRWVEIIEVAKILFENPSMSAQGFMGGVEGLFCALAMLTIRRGRPYVSEVLRLVKTTKQEDYEELAFEVGYPAAAAEFIDIAGKPAETAAAFPSVMGNSGLQLWRDPFVARATQGEDITFDNLRRKPATIYFRLRGKKIEEFQPLIRLFFLDLINTLETDEPGPDEPFKVLIALDEFQRLGKMDRVLQAFDTIRSFGGRMLVITQTLSRLYEIYSRDGTNAALDSAGTQMFTATGDIAAKEYVSESIGDKTVISKSRSRSIDEIDLGSVSTKEEGIPLISAAKVGRFKKEKLILLREGKMPTIANKIRYFEDPYFVQFTGAAPPQIKGNWVDLSQEQAAEINHMLAERKEPKEQVGNNHQAVEGEEPISSETLTPDDQRLAEKFTERMDESLEAVEDIKSDDIALQSDKSGNIDRSTMDSALSGFG